MIGGCDGATLDRGVTLPYAVDGEEREGRVCARHARQLGVGSDAHHSIARPLPNADLRALLTPLDRPVYVLRMAAGLYRPWSRDARLRHVLRYREALRVALAAVDDWIVAERRRAADEEDA